MKKTNSMRVAVAMLALTLITSCFVGGTFAKYTTSASGDDSARVAKFGVVIDASNSAFLDKYEVADAENAKFEGGYSVASSNGDKVVAPGTSGTIDLFTLSGTPEVAVRINVEMDNVESIMIKPIIGFTKVTVEEWEVIQYEYDVGSFQNVEVGRYTESKVIGTEDVSDTSARPDGETWTQNMGDSWEPDIHTFRETYESKLDDVAAYYPIKWTLIKDDEAVEGATDITLAAVKDYIDENINIECAPGTDLSTISGTYKLAWEWNFEGDNVAYDAYDTILGNIAAEKYGIYLSKEENEKLENKEYNLTEAFDFSITVTQID